MGIVTFIHGFGDYSGRYAYLAKEFAAKGYEFHTMDQRGYGFSEGRKAVIESEQIVKGDLLEHTRLVNEKFGGKDVPHFLVGHSLGGQLSLWMAAQNPNLFNGISLWAPYIGLSEDRAE